MRAVRRLLPATAAATASLACATSAQAAITTTSVTAPASGSHLLYDADAGPAAAGNQLKITGTAAGASAGDAVNLVCAYRDSNGDWRFHPIASGIDASSGSFTADVTLDAFTSTASDTAGPERPRGCKLIALDAAAPALPPTLPGTASGPLVATSMKSFQATENFRNGKRTSFSVWATGFRGGAQLVSPGRGGAAYYFFADAPDRLRQSENIFYDNPALYDEDRNGGTRSSVRIDGRDAFDPYAASQLYTDAADSPGFSELRIDGLSFDEATGTTIVDASSPLVRCTANVARPAVTSTTCSTFAQTGVRLARRIIVDHDGAMITVQDRFLSADGHSHALDVLYAQDGDEPKAGAMRFWFPWLDTSFRTTGQAAGNVIAAPPTRVSTTLVKSNSAALDGDERYPLGSHTVSSAPGLLRFYNAANWENGYVRTIPAGGAVAIQQTYAQTTTLAALMALRSDAENSARSTLTVSFDAPATTTVPTTTATGRASGLGTITGLTLNGTAVPVAANGTWSGTAALQPGENTLTATVTDSNGDKETATRKVTYTPPPAKLTVGKVTFKNGVFSAKGSCPALATTACTGVVKVTAKVKTKVKVRKGGKTRTKTRTKTVTLAAGKVTAAQGKTRTLKVKLSRKGKAALAKARKLKATVTITQVVDGKRSATRRTLTIRAPKKKPSRRG